MTRSATEWQMILIACGVDDHTASTWGPVFADVITEKSFSQGDLELDDFLGQILHESGKLTRLSENLNYSAERLCAVWPGRFPTLESAQPFAHNPEALANFVYGGRMGNTEPGDGWFYRGRTPIQLTGKDNYAHVGDLMGQDLVTSPELLEQPRFALEACIHWWEDRIPDSMLGDVTKITKRVNGGLLGLAEREHITQEAKEALA
jgi:putative chitinase